MDIRQLVYFLQIVKDGTFSSAAKNLYISQPALSKAIRNLEDEFGVQLFHRSDKQLTLTDVGKALYPKALHLIDEYNAVVDTIQQLADSSQTQLHLGIPYGLSSQLFYQLTSEFSDSFPNVKLIVSGHGSTSVRQSVLDGDVDIGVTTVPPEVSPDLDVTPVSKSNYYLLVSAQHPLAKEKSVSFSQLKDEDFIMFSDEFLISQATIENCQAAGFTPKVRYTVNRSDFIPDLVASNRGIAILSDSRPIHQLNPRLACVDLADGNIHFDVALITRKGAYLSTAAQQFISFSTGHLLEFFQEQTPDWLPLSPDQGQNAEENPA